MDNSLSALEEFDAQRKIQYPHLLYSATDMVAKKKMAYVVLAKKGDELLLIEPSGFGEATVIAGLTVGDIEYFSKHAPRDCKENLISTVRNDLLVKDIFEIAQAMDDDLGGGATTNQQRVKKVMQYISDNRIAFQF